MESALALSGSDRLPACLHGPESETAPAHRHAFWLPEDRDGDGWLDHLTVYTPGGLDEAGAAILDGMAALRLDAVGTFALQPALLDAAALGPARVWHSASPYFGPHNAWHGTAHRPKPGESAAEQLARDLGWFRAARGSELPAFQIAARGARNPRAQRFNLTQRLAAKCPPHAVRGWFEISFDAPVLGPVALGFGAHFGLGQFRATLPRTARQEAPPA